MHDQNQPQELPQVPDSFYCPILQNIMKNPVIDPEGNSYEREAIIQWLSKNSVSPITRRPLNESQLTPNRALKDIIENFLKTTQNVELTRVPKVPQVSDKIKLKAFTSADCNQLLVSLVPPEGIERTPLDISCVIDVSGSMGSEATVKSESGINESHGLSILDIVKHAVKTIIHSLDDNDRLGIVSFDSVSHSVLQLTNMTPNGRETATKNLEELDANGSTNLWGGLKSGLDLLHGDSRKNRLKVVLLLTDGEPTVIPPRGHIPVLKSYLEDNKDANEYLIFTFGFGYSLDSKLLDEIARVGNGTYSFIPDCNFVGTVFINTMANLSTILGSNVHVKLDFGGPLPNRIKIPGYTFKQIDNAVHVNLGNIRHGQSRDLVVCYDSHSSPVKVSTRFQDVTNNNELSEISVESHLVSTNEEIEIHILRQELIELLHKIVYTTKCSKENEELVSQLVSNIKNSSCVNNEFAESLLKDVEGQIKESIANEAYQRWGRHYLPSLSCAHKFQQCNNFKDFGVQKYGGKLFSIIQKEADKLFSELPPPKPQHNNFQPSYNTTTTNPSFSMATYNDQWGGCFDGDCLVEMFSGGLMKVKHVKRGQLVKGSDGSPCEIICVVKTIIPSSRAELVEFEGGLKITKWHPIRRNGTWEYPINLKDSKLIESKEIFTFVLDKGHTVKINSIECVTLGHNFTENVVAHPYFGTAMVINDLKQMHGWESGLIELGKVKRDPSTGFIDGVKEVWHQSHPINSLSVF